MAKIEDLISEIADNRLRLEISREVAILKKQKKFGLVFEEHIPETVQIPGLSVRPGANVVKRGTGNKEIYFVKELSGDGKALIQKNGDKTSEEMVRDKDLVVVKRFGDPIYPTLTPIAKLTRAEGKPYHTIINSDNFHALQLLLYCYSGQVDVIYIDPPYNTGARDWKYNNDYVDSNDQWRHSKWLSMMKKRLLLAKHLLKRDGVMIVTIDDYENASLSILLDELFPDKTRLPLIIRYNRSGSPRLGIFRVHEYAHIMASKDLCSVANETYTTVRNFRRNGNNSTRIARPTMFFSICVEKKTLKMLKVGEFLQINSHPKGQTIDKGTHYEVWPIDDDGTERVWCWSPKRVLEKHEEIEIREKNGRVDFYFKTENTPISENQTVWVGKEFDAATHGSSLVQDVVGVRFPFPKSLYAVKRCLELAVKDNKSALIVDFFSGSGTTYHATALLNSEDGGDRRCILITNNEVNEKHAIDLNRKGIFPGDPKFEEHGICESVTWPRCKYVTQGHRDDKTKLPGTYLNDREMKQGFDENLEYFRLDFLDPHEVAYGEKFEAIIPILWLMAGAKGELETARGYSKWFIPKHSPYAVLIKEDAFGAFKRELKARPDISFVFLVTDSEEAFRAMSSDLPGKPHTKMLYKSYLDNFRINTEKIL